MDRRAMDLTRALKCTALIMPPFAKAICQMSFLLLIYSSLLGQKREKRIDVKILDVNSKSRIYRRE